MVVRLGLQSVLLFGQIALWAAAGAQAASPCKVIDPELQDGYEGPCRGGLAHGKGVARGFAVYHGEFRRGLKDGQGIKTWPWGDRYEGRFRDDKKDGYGVYSWGSGTPWAGERYEGEFAQDLRQGWGVYMWPSGDRYEGPWEKDQRRTYSVMETRRMQAESSQREAFQQGVKVCSLHRPGVEMPAIGRGQVEAYDGKTLQVRLTEVPPMAAPVFHERAVVGMVIEDEAVNWAPCN